MASIESSGDGTTRTGLGIWAVFAFALAVISIGIAYLPFHLITHGWWEYSLPLFARFYTQANMGFLTLLWYIPMTLAWGIGWMVTRWFRTYWIRVVFRAGLTAILLSPGVFVNPITFNSVAALLDVSRFANSSVSPTWVLPVLVCIAGYALWSPYVYFLITAILLSLWPIPTVWFSIIFATVVLRYCRKNKLQDIG